MRYDTRDWVVAKQLLDEIAMIKSALLVSFYPPSGILRSPPRPPRIYTRQRAAPAARPAARRRGGRPRDGYTDDGGRLIDGRLRQQSDWRRLRAPAGCARERCRGGAPPAPAPAGATTCIGTSSLVFNFVYVIFPVSRVSQRQRQRERNRELAPDYPTTGRKVSTLESVSDNHAC